MAAISVGPAFFYKSSEIVSPVVTPSGGDIRGLDMVYQGQPFYVVSMGFTSDTLNVAHQAQPFYFFQ